jgi:CO/xanthine dehydrogenase Mo-binding subunit
VTTAAPESKANMGQPIPRYDAVAKVTGKAAYAADMPLINPVYAYLVTSSIAKGRVDSFDLAAANKVRGVIDIVTHEIGNGAYTVIAQAAAEKLDVPVEKVSGPSATANCRLRRWPEARTRRQAHARLS